MVFEKSKFKWFMKKHQNDYDALINSFVALFNKCSKETKNGAIQFVLLGSVLASFLKSSGFSKDEKIKLLDELKTNLERE